MNFKKVMIRSLILFILCHLVFLLSACSKTSDLSGKYILKSKAFDGELHIKMLNQKEFKFYLNTANKRTGGLCDIEGVAKIAANNRAVFKDNETNCEIEFVIKGNSIEVKPNEDCMYYCGASGMLEGLYVKASAKEESEEMAEEKTEKETLKEWRLLGHTDSFDIYLKEDDVEENIKYSLTPSAFVRLEYKKPGIKWAIERYGEGFKSLKYAVAFWMCTCRGTYKIAEIVWYDKYGNVLGSETASLYDWHVIMPNSAAEIVCNEICRLKEIKKEYNLQEEK
jgi:hypothetical protein